VPEPGTLEAWEAEQKKRRKTPASKPVDETPGTSGLTTKKRGATKPKPQALITRLSDVEPQDVAWLWHPYIPLGKLTLLEGDPGLGKTFISLTLAAAITRGWPLLSQTGAPGEELEPADVLYMSAEDGLADTLRPRLDAADADVSRVHALTGWRLDDGNESAEGAVSLGDIPILEQALTQTKPKLIIIDPLQAYLGAKVDMHRANEVRPLLSALGNLAEKHECAVICIRHLSKALSPKAIYSGMGSIDFAAAARSILTVGEHDGERLLAHVKSSLAPQGKSIRYELWDGSLNWLGISDITAEELRVPQTVEAEGSTVDAAVTFLQDYLEDGAQASSKVSRAAKEAGISNATLRRAKEKLDVKYDRQNVSGGERGSGIWVCSLPDNPLRVQAEQVERLEENRVLDGAVQLVSTCSIETAEQVEKTRQGRENVQLVQDAHLEPLGGYDRLRKRLEAQKWPVPSAGKLLDFYRRADAGDTEARGAIDDYLQNPQVVQALEVNREAA